MSEKNEQDLKEPINLNNPSFRFKQLILNELWDFCETEFGADFENDYVTGLGYKFGLSDRTDIFVEHLIKTINKRLIDIPEEIKEKK